jgi:hypothetical protein
LEALGSILSGYTTLDCEATLRNSILGQTKLREGSSSGDLNLGSNDIDASYFLCQK